MVQVGSKTVTGKTVVVADGKGTDFFSPHPVVSVDSTEALRDFMAGRPVAFGIVKPDLPKRLADRLGSDFRVDVLRVFENESVVRIVHVP